MVYRFKPRTQRAPMVVDMEAIIGDKPPREVPSYAARWLAKFQGDTAGLLAVVERGAAQHKLKSSSNHLGMRRFEFSDGSMLVFRIVGAPVVVDLEDSDSLRAYFDSLGGVWAARGAVHPGAAGDALRHLDNILKGLPHGQ